MGLYEEPAIYLLADNFFRFWYRFVSVNASAIDSGRMMKTYPQNSQENIMNIGSSGGIDIGQLKLRNAPAGIAQGVVFVITVKQDRTESVLRSDVCEERCNQSLADPSFCSSDHHKFRHTFKPSISPAARRPSVRLQRSAGPPRQRRGGRFPSSGCTPGSLWRPSS